MDSHLFRLVHIRTGVVSKHDLTAAPPYVAVSHVWSDELFPPNVDFLACPGRGALISVVHQKVPSMCWCWMDTKCILQENADDKKSQIPLMGSIFGKAEMVIIVLKHELNLPQATVDSVTNRLDEAVRMHEEESWQENGSYWQNGAGRGLIHTAMIGLARLANTNWATRVWTLQEYILARSIIWVGRDCMPVRINDILFAALPDICDTLSIDECLGMPFERLYKYYSGMANCRIGRIDRTRVMELLGNRQATLECDEVYGVMAASGVEITSNANDTKERAWQRWLEQAVNKGHLRWLLMPKTIQYSGGKIRSPNCLVVPFSQRHTISASAALDTVTPLGPVQVTDGIIKVKARWIAFCRVLSPLGTVHSPRTGRIHRDITLILFTKGRYSRATTMATVFGAGRYSPRQLKIIARTLVNNYDRAILCVKREAEDSFRVRTSDLKEYTIWQDFIAFQMGQMPGMNEGIAYLAKLQRKSLQLCIVIVLGNAPVPKTELEVIDLNGRTQDERCIFMIVHRHSLRSNSSAASTEVLHKVAVSLPITGDLEPYIQQIPLQTFWLGGRRCWCRESSPKEPTFTPLTESGASKAVEKVTMAQAKSKAHRQRTVQTLQLRLARQKLSGLSAGFRAKLRTSRMKAYMRSNRGIL